MWVCTICVLVVFNEVSFYLFLFYSAFLRRFECFPFACHLETVSHSMRLSVITLKNTLVQFGVHYPTYFSLIFVNTGCRLKIYGRKSQNMCSDVNHGSQYSLFFLVGDMAFSSVFELIRLSINVKISCSILLFCFHDFPFVNLMRVCTTI